MTLHSNPNAPPSGLPAWARVGAKVVCVAAVMHRHPMVDSNDEPIVGNIYTLDGWLREKRGRWYCGIVGMPSTDCYALDRFRPLITRTQEQDVALFKHLTTPVLEPVNAQ